MRYAEPPLCRLLLRMCLFASLLSLGACRWWDPERTVILLSESVTLTPEPLVIEAPKHTPASGTSFWLTVHLAQKPVCVADEWAPEAAKRLPELQAILLLSDGQRHRMIAETCCTTNICGVYKLNTYLKDTQPGRHLVWVAIFAPEPTRITRVTWYYRVPNVKYPNDR